MAEHETDLASKLEAHWQAAYASVQGDTFADRMARQSLEAIRLDHG